MRIAKKTIFIGSVQGEFLTERRAKDAGLDEPDFIKAEDFRTIIYRPVRQATEQDTVQDTMQVDEQVKHCYRLSKENKRGMS